MLQKMTRQLLYKFCRSQNFFEMNPVFPDMGDKDFDLYNSDRKKINILDTYASYENRTTKIKDIVRKKLHARIYEKYRKFTGGKKIRMDKTTNLPIGMDSDFDTFIEQFKRSKLDTKNAKSEFRTALLKLVQKFNCRSEPELIRLFRISIANSRKKNLLDKIRAEVMKKALIKTSGMRKPLIKEKQALEDAQEEEFEKILQQLDEKIEQAEKALRYDEYGVPKIMSSYDPDYGWEVTREARDNQHYDFNIQNGPQKIIEKTPFNPSKNMHDESLRSRINRLYFLRRLEHLSKESDDNITFYEDLPINLGKHQNIMNEIAHKYKQAELIQEPDLQEIYREVDIVINKVFIKVAGGESYRSRNTDQTQVYDKSLDTSHYLWDSINVDEVFCSDFYSDDAIRDEKLSEETVKSLTPNPDLQVSLGRVPVNLYRHSQFEIFGVFNEYKQRMGKKIFRAEELDFEPQFDQFDIQEAQDKYEEFEEKVQQGIINAYGKAKRKKSEAEVFVSRGTGLVTVNDKPIQDYFADVMYRVEALKPLIFTQTGGEFNLKFNVAGSGVHGQSQCMAYALTRALIKINPDYERILAGAGLVGFDTRIKQRKKTNLYSARVRPPYVRR